MAEFPLEESKYLIDLYSKEGKTKKLIHELKYKGNEEYRNFSREFGLGELLIENSNEFTDSRLYCTCSIAS